MSDRERRRLDAARAIVQMVGDHLNADLSVQLWNGEVVPLGPNAKPDIRLVVRSSAAFRRLLLKPSLMTVYELFATGDLDISGASPLQAADRWDHMSVRNLTAALDRRKMAILAWPFLFGGSTRRAATPSFDSQVAQTPAAGRNDQELIAFHYDVSNDFYALFLDPEMSIRAATSPTPRLRSKTPRSPSSTAFARNCASRPVIGYSTSVAAGVGYCVTR